jgi:hypothetical protein
MIKTVSLSFETPALSTNDAKVVRKFADAYLRANLTKLNPLVKVLSYVHTSTVSDTIEILRKQYTVYVVTYVFDVDAPGTDIATQALEGAFSLPTRRGKDRYFLRARKAI